MLGLGLQITKTVGALASAVTAWILNTDATPVGGTIYQWDDSAIWDDANTWKD